MANQLSHFAISGGDLPFKNYGGSAIAAGKAVKIDTSNQASGSALPGVVVTSSDVGVIGITVESIPAGGIGRVRVMGAYPATASGAVTGGTWLMAGASGVVLTQTSAKEAIGRALNTAADGDPVLVLIQPAKNA